MKKRYLLLTCFFIYFALKLYTSYTPSTDDDAWPEDFKEGAKVILSSNDKRDFGEHA